MTKLSIFNLYGTDKESEEEGKWIELGNEISVKIRRYTAKKSAAVRKALFKAYEPRPGALKAPVIPDEVNNDLTNRHLARGVIVDWKGVYDVEGNEIPYSEDKAYELLTALPDFGIEIVRASIDMDTFRATAEDVGKNS